MSRSGSFQEAAPSAFPDDGPRARPLVADLLELSKARLCALVVVTAAVGYLLGRAEPFDWLRFVLAMLGTALSGFGANAFNQWLEVDRDARMRRTANRPLPAGRMTRRAAFTYALTVSIAGPAILWLFVNPLTCGLAIACHLLYVLVYTPMKTRSPLNTLVGAVCGAIPPMMGWAAATGRLEFGAWVLGTILFLWQIPHFLALAWMYRDEYARGGFRMLPAVDTSGRLSCRLILLYSLLLIPLGLSVTLAGIAGGWFAVGSVVLGIGLLLLGIRLERDRSQANARRVFFASIIYLPLMLGLMVADRMPASRRHGIRPVDYRASAQHQTALFGAAGDAARGLTSTRSAAAAEPARNRILLAELPAIFGEPAH